MMDGHTSTQFTRCSITRLLLLVMIVACLFVPGLKSVAAQPPAENSTDVQAADSPANDAGSADTNASNRPGGKPPLTPEQKAKAASARAGAQLLVAVLLLFLLTVMFVCLYGYLLRRRLRKRMPAASAPRDELWYLKPQKKGAELAAAVSKDKPAANPSANPVDSVPPTSSGTAGNRPVDLLGSLADEPGDEPLTSVGSSDQTAFGQPPAPNLPLPPPVDDEENDDDRPADGDHDNRNGSGPGSGKPSK